jgi:hypothetical protein
MAHKSQKLQFEIVAVLGLLALFTHIHLFWIAGLLLAMIDLPDFSTPLRSIAGSVARIAGVPPDAPLTADKPDEHHAHVSAPPASADGMKAEETKKPEATGEVQGHA